MGPDGLFVSHRRGSHSSGIHVPFTNCFVCSWFCVVHYPKPPLHSHNWLSFGKFQDTERFLIHCENQFRHDYPLAVEPGSTPRPLVPKKLGEILYLLICSFLPCLSWLLRSRVRKSRRNLWITMYIPRERVSSLGYLACNAHAPYCLLSARMYIFSHYLIKGNIFEIIRY